MKRSWGYSPRRLYLRSCCWLIRVARCFMIWGLWSTRIWIVWYRCVVFVALATGSLLSYVSRAVISKFKSLPSLSLRRRQKMLHAPLQRWTTFARQASASIGRAANIEHWRSWVDPNQGSRSCTETGLEGWLHRHAYKWAAECWNRWSSSVMMMVMMIKMTYPCSPSVAMMVIRADYL